MQIKKRVLAILIGAFIVTGIAWLFHGKNEARAVSDNVAATPIFIRTGEQLTVPVGSPLRQHLVVKAVASLEAAHAVILPAQVEADPAHTINILPSVTGKVVELNVGLGDQVKQGQLLLVLASSDFAQAVSDQQKAADALQLSKKALERQRGVQDAGAGAAKDLEQAASTYVQARAEFSRADTRLRALSGPSSDSSARHLKVLAPTSGSITALSIGVGQNANDPTVAIMTISDLAHVWITANVPEDLLSSIKKGQQVTITLPAYPGMQLQGKVAFISDVLQPDTRRSLVRVSVSNADRKLKPNMYASAAFDVAQTAAPVVPSSALLMNNDDITVFVESSPWTFMRRTVQIGSEEGGQVRIQSGLNVGERVVTSGGVLLND